MLNRVYRPMLAAKDGNGPRVGTSSVSLGIRQRSEGHARTDLPVVNGEVDTGTGGLSVSRAPHEVPHFLIPISLVAQFPKAAGDDATKLWRLGDSEFQPGPVATGLALRIDPDDMTHGFVEPERRMTLVEYRERILATQSLWQEVPWLP